MKNVREITNKIYDAMDEHLIDIEYLAIACLKWMSESDVRRMNDVYEFVITDEEEE